MASIQETAVAMEAQDATEEREVAVTPLELFFDLVFVYALTQVTAFMAENPTWAQLVRGLMITAVVWWAWVAYSWLTNVFDEQRATVVIDADDDDARATFEASEKDEDRVRVAIFAAMAAMFIVALAIPNAFGDEGLLFACAYFVVRAVHILLYAYAANDAGVQQAIRRLAPGVLVGTGLLIVASQLDGFAQGALWAIAIVVDFSAALAGRAEGWTVHAGHFAERHGLIIIIAIGESIVAVGVGAEKTGLDAATVAACVLGVVIAAALWWAYFDVVSPVAARHLREQPKGGIQNRMARDSYSYIHLLMIAGIVLLALGAKKTLAQVDEPLKVVPAFALCGGVALYLFGHIAFRLRNIGTLNRQRVVVALVALALIPVATRVDALVTIALLAALTAGLIVFEATRFRDSRFRIHAAARAG